LHAFALIDLTVANGTTDVFVPSKTETLNPVNLLDASDKGFNFPTRDQRQQRAAAPDSHLKGVEETRKLVATGELGGRWSMPVLIAAGGELIKPEVVRVVGAWGVDISVRNSNSGLEEYIKALQA
jgi:hypothetical protein